MITITCMKGIDPENIQHKEYLMKMTTDFEEQVCRLIKDGIRNREESLFTKNVLFEECLQHLRFAHEKSKNFHGRGSVMKVNLKPKPYVAMLYACPKIVFLLSVYITYIFLLFSQVYNALFIKQFHNKVLR